MATEIKSPNSCTIEIGDTFLSIKAIDGHLFVVDQEGKVVNGLMSCTATTSVDAITTITMTVTSYS